ncbi:hypothetical protein ACE6H2_002755 [Prunus campanulata]
MVLICSICPFMFCLCLLGGGFGCFGFMFVFLLFIGMLFLHRSHAASSRRLVFTTMSCSSTLLLSFICDTNVVDDAFKVHPTLIYVIMVALFVHVMAYPSPFSFGTFDYGFFYGGFGLAFGTLLIGYWWCGISEFLVLCYLMYFVCLVLKWSG